MQKFNFSLLLLYLMISCQSKKDDNLTIKVSDSLSSTNNIKVDTNQIKSDSLNSVNIIQINNEQDKRETIDWLNSKFGENIEVIRPSKSESLYTRLKINNDGSFIISSYNELSDSNGDLISKDITTFTGNFKDLSLNSFNVREESNYTFSSKKVWYLFVSCHQSNSNCITQTTYRNFTKIEDNQIDEIFHNKEVMISYVTDNMDHSLIDRSQKAFTHLIELYGGKREKF